MSSMDSVKSAVSLGTSYACLTRVLLDDTDTEVNEHMEYANLIDNPERYTGYSGDAAHRIWNSIYTENCFECVFCRFLLSSFALNIL